MKFNPTPEVRRWIYGVIVAVVPLLTVLNIVSGDVAGHIIAIATAVLGLTGSAMAYRNVPSQDEKK
jgi:hypothetical protein